MILLTASTLRSISQVDYTDKGFPVPTGSAADPLTREIGRAVAWLQWTTGRLQSEFDSIDDTMVSDPLYVDSVNWELATQLRTEQQINHRTADYTDDFYDDVNDVTLTGYATKRIADKERRPEGMITSLKELDDLLWFLMTQDKRSYWLNQLAGGAMTPVEIVNYEDSSTDSGYLIGDSMWGFLRGINEL